ncbi:hypothetical protein BBD42_09880 [Paenibacillus sp. BIHB 4019]|uniref:Uncharacterized protein n=1 Tax=Paenibacillus sp. BIHB 4019 TaxID=1870819 RepID=A0A1B2DG96_9BACL|nr:hypothetical protein [Paenibacillus sp. BIHB 4019]ANY66738.1 hypothetical protein BBD42_09880 [Paenibacillus sp. BIHB 4019]
MKRAGMYSLVVIFSYLIGVLFYKVAYSVLSISERSEYDLLYTGINLFFIFCVVPAYFLIVLILKSVNIQSTAVYALLLTIFGFIPSTLVPFMGGFGFIFLTPSYYISEMAMLLYAFFTGTAVSFSLGVKILRHYPALLK